MKITLAALLRRETTLTFRETAERLSMGTPGYVAKLLGIYGKSTRL